MKNRIIEICELGQPKSIIHRENEPISELIKTIDLVGELNKQLLLHNVSQLRELLKAYTKWLNDKIRDEDDLNELIDNYLKDINYTYCCEELCDKCSKENHLQKLTDQAQDLGLGYD
jgi:hypothetical protein